MSFFSRSVVSSVVRGWHVNVTRLRLLGDLPTHSMVDGTETVSM